MALNNDLIKSWSRIKELEQVINSNGSGEENRVKTQVTKVNKELQQKNALEI